MSLDPHQSSWEGLRLGPLLEEHPSEAVLLADDVDHAAVLVDVLASDAWDIAIGELVATSRPKHRAGTPVLSEETDYVGEHSADVVEGEVITDDKVGNGEGTS
jgi:hypothetical protein